MDKIHLEFLLTAIFALLVVIDIFGNVIVCIVILKKRFRIQYTQGKSSMDYLLVNLAVSDILFAAFVIPRYILSHAYHHPGDLIGDVLCKVVTGGSFIWVGGAASVFSLLLIAIDRYNAVIYPHSLQQRISLKILPFLLITCWVTSVILCMPLFFVMKYNPQKDFCIEEWSKSVLPKVYGIVWLLYGGVPILVMGYLYIKIIRVLWFQRPMFSFRNSQKLRYSSAVLLSRRKACKLSITVTALYSVCWLPILVFYIISFHSPSSVEYGSILYKSSVAMTCLNSSMNPFVYALQSQRFRRCVKGLFHCK